MDGRCAANHACSSGALAASAKNGGPIETANRPSSQNASPVSPGRLQPDAIDSGSHRQATTINATWIITERRPGA